jgi:hypothetical protein
VKAIYDRVNEVRIVQVGMLCCYQDMTFLWSQVRGTPASGKSTLAALLARYIERTIGRRPVCIFGWAEDKDYHTQLRRGGWNFSTTQVDYLLIDKAQLLYRENQDVSFWHGFVKTHLGEPQSPLRLVLFTSYGSVHSKVPVLCGRPIGPILLTPLQRITLQRDRIIEFEDDEYKCTGLLLSREEFEEMCRNRYPPIRFEDDLLNWVYETTSGHAGAISALFTIICNHHVRHL